MSQSSLPSIEALNSLARESFVQSLEVLFEGGGSLLEALWDRRPFESYQSMLEEAARVCDALSVAQKTLLLNAHPRIGAPRAELQRRSRLSYAEQGYGGSAAESGEERLNRELARLNESYEARFGFRFVVFVNRRSRATLLPVLRARMARSVEEEMATALGELLAIARDRASQLGGL